MSRHTAPMTDTYIHALRRRNAIRMENAKQQLGERWLLHKANAVRRTEPDEWFLSPLPHIKAGWPRITEASQ